MCKIATMLHRFVLVLGFMEKENEGGEKDLVA